MRENAITIDKLLHYAAFICPTRGSKGWCVKNTGNLTLPNFFFVPNLKKGRLDYLPFLEPGVIPTELSYKVKNTYLPDALV